MNRPMFNTGALFDIPTGEYVQPTPSQLVDGSYNTVQSVFSKTNMSIRTYGILDRLLRKTKGGTVERFTIAVQLFALMGFSVKWDGTAKEPEVTWYDTEGWSIELNVAEIIHDTLHKEYEPEDNHLAIELHESIKTADKETLITLDSYSELT